MQSRSTNIATAMHPGSLARAHNSSGLAGSSRHGLAVSGPPGLLVAEVAAKAAMSRRGNRAFSNEKSTRRPISKRRRFTNVRRRRRWTPA